MLLVVGRDWRLDALCGAVLVVCAYARRRGRVSGAVRKESHWFSMNDMAQRGAHSGDGGLPGEKPRRCFGDVFCVGALVLLCLAIGLPRYRVGIGLADEGFLAYGAARVMEGQLPNRDFVSVQPPLSFYTAAATLKLLGTSLASLRMLGLGLHLLIPLLVYAISRSLTGRVLSAMAAVPATVLGLPFFNFVPFAAWQGMAATLMAVLCYLQAARGGRRRYLALPAGVMTAAALLSRQDQGLYLVISISALTLALRQARDGRLSRADLNRVFRLWLMGVVGVMVPLAVFWLGQGALPQMFEQLLVFPVTTYARTSALPFPVFRAGQAFVSNVIAALCYVLPAFAIAAALWLANRIVRRHFRLREAYLAFLLVWSALFYCQVLTRSDVYHLVIALPPFLILWGYGWESVWERWNPVSERSRLGPKIVGYLLLSVWSAGVIWFLWSVKPLYLTDPAEARQTISLDRAGVRVADAAPLEGLVHLVQRYAPADRSILCLPYQPMLYFLCERRNPTHWNYLWPGDQTAEDHEALIREARSDPPAVVLIADEAEMSLYAAAILDYVHSEYRRALQAGRVTVYLP